MKTVCELNKCAGCMACVDDCPKNAITVVDSISYYNADIDEDKCIGCNLCHSVCQASNPPKLVKPFAWFQGWANDESIRSSSASGGFAAAIQRQFILDGGIVCSCVFREGKFVFSSATTVEEVKKFGGSKYVKSNPSGIYLEIKHYLKQGKKVLFTGLPCQVASLKNYIKDDSLLYMIDLVCHGTPSPKVLDKFLLDLGKRLSNVHAMSFRTGNQYTITLDGKNISIPRVIDYYSMCFYDSLIFTENCYQCRYAQINRVADLTLGDSWGSELPKETRDRGVSLALCQTAKGKELLDMADLVLLDVDIDKALEANTQLRQSSVKTKNVDIILNGIIQGKKLDSIICKLYPKLHLKNMVKRSLFSLGIKY